MAQGIGHLSVWLAWTYVEISPEESKLFTRNIRQQAPDLYDATLDEIAKIREKVKKKTGKRPDF